MVLFTLLNTHIFKEAHFINKGNAKFLEEYTWEFATVSTSVHIWSEDTFHHFFFLSTAAPAAYVSSQPRSQIRTAAAAYVRATATSDLRPICKLHRILQPCHILNPLSKARDETCIVTNSSLLPAEPQQELHLSTLFTLCYLNCL